MWLGMWQVAGTGRKLVLLMSKLSKTNLKLCQLSNMEHQKNINAASTRAAQLPRYPAKSNAWEALHLDLNLDSGLGHGLLLTVPFPTACLFSLFCAHELQLN